MTEIIIPIHPEWRKKIYDREKPIEVRKTAPEPPFKARIYATKPTGAYSWALCRDKDYGIGLVAKCNYGAAERLGFEILSGKIIGEFTCYKVGEIGYSPYNHGEYISLDYETEDRSIKGTCLTFERMYDYLGEEVGKGIEISDLKLYDIPKNLLDFGLERAPQSWCYVKEKR